MISARHGTPIRSRYRYSYRGTKTPYSTKDRRIECQEITRRRGWSNGGRRGRSFSIVLFIIIFSFAHAYIGRPENTFSSHHASIIIITVRSPLDRQQHSAHSRAAHQNVIHTRSFFLVFLNFLFF